jgi:hypothetical protein
LVYIATEYAVFSQIRFKYWKLSNDYLIVLRDKYLKLIKLEIEEFGVKPTEIRHLIGRLGEFERALIVDGELSHRANQHGFDVISKDGRKISVKITAQMSGCVAISEKTLHFADDPHVASICRWGVSNNLLWLYKKGCICCS